jgi:dihydroxyacetone kinase
MTHIIETADGFVDDALEGFARVHSSLVRRVDGGVVRARPLRPGTVAVVVGGGSGHYPAFAGLVGAGLAAGAVCGNIFSSPSAGQAVRVAEEAHGGGGVLFLFGNYAGDVLHFGEAQRRLNEAGIDTRTVLVTDDVASAPVQSVELRRGIAGDLCVFRIAGAAAERGLAIDEVERIARSANDRTRTLGVAFAGCTLPGASAPLFTVPEGMMSIGLGIHGEPGIRDVPLQSARDLASTLLEPLLAERPAGAGTRVVLLVNGLGTVKYEELFVLYRYASEQLEAAELEIVQPECGELVTSLDMAGASITLLWLDDELESLWAEPAETPAYRKGVVQQAGEAIARQPTTTQPKAAEPAQATTASLQLASLAGRLIETALETVRGEAAELGRLDAVAGDGDHGEGMLRGLQAAHDFVAAHPQLGVEALLLGAGDAWSETAGGTSGALWGGALGAIATTLGNREQYGPPELGDAITAAVHRVRELGGANLGDKTMVDAMAPFDDALRAALNGGAASPAALAVAATAARDAAAATAGLRPLRGRARPLAERSIGHADPGAVSFSLIVSACEAELAR